MDAKRAAEVLRVMMLDGDNYREDCQATEAGAQALEAWVWVERKKAEIKPFAEQYGVFLNNGTCAVVTADPLESVLIAMRMDAMEKEGI